MEQKILRIKELIQQLNEACHYYYNESKNKMENKEYNLLFDELQALENETNIILSNSPTQRAGFTVVGSNLPKVKHDIPLLSLDKIKDVNDLIKWLGDKEGVLMLKMDGGTGKAEYNNYTSYQLSTRGDSHTNEGEDISHNLSSINNIPKKIFIPNDTQVVGEMYMDFEDFNRINNKITDVDKKYSNPRNLANATASITDSKICKERNIKFKAFNIIKGIDFKTKVEQLEWLKSQGFDIVDYWVVNKNNLKETMEKIQDNIPNLPFPIDGLVLSYNDLAYGLSLGKTGHHFKHSISFKFEDNWYETEYDYTEWNTTRTSQIVPTGIFKTVFIEGSEVSRASLSNISIFESLKLGKGDTIETCKRNMIIPKIENNITRSNTEKIPTECPCCHGKVEIRQDNKSKILYCLNSDCSSKQITTIDHYCDKKNMNIKGFSEATIEKFVNKGFISNIIDIYTLEQYKSEIINMEGFGIKSYNNLIKSINDSKKCKLSNFISALGIPNVGNSTAKELANNFKNINSFRMCCKEQLLKMKDIGETTSDNIVEWLRKADNQNLINDLLEYINFIEEEKKEMKEGVFSNKSIYCSGIFACGKKNDLKKMVEDNGGTFTEGLNKSLSYLVIGSIKGSSKEDKARNMNVPVLTEEEFLKMIGR